ncbi:MAG TPA: PIN domain-containing protein [Flavobacteriales bacterium]|nr:PIN domain-containing protein [Flavobacteriales bacterium]
MRVLIDANIIADAILTSEERKQGDRHNAQLVLEAVARGRITGLITPPIFVLAVQIVKPRRAHHRERVQQALEFLLDIAEWVPINPDHCRTALASSFHDVEDGIEFFACRGPEAIVTRDSDFRDHVNVPVYTAAEFVKKHLK